MSIPASFFTKEGERQFLTQEVFALGQYREFAERHGISRRAAFALVPKFGLQSTPEDWAAAGIESLSRISGCGPATLREITNFLAAGGLVKKIPPLDSVDKEKVRLERRMAKYGGKIVWKNPPGGDA